MRLPVHVGIHIHDRVQCNGTSVQIFTIIDVYLTGFESRSVSIFFRHREKYQVKGKFDTIRSQTL